MWEDSTRVILSHLHLALCSPQVPPSAFWHGCVIEVLVLPRGDGKLRPCFYDALLLSGFGQAVFTASQAVSSFARNRCCVVCNSLLACKHYCLQRSVMCQHGAYVPVCPLRPAVPGMQACACM